MNKLPESFYNRDTLDVSKDLLAKRLVRVVDGERMVALITEVEAYKGAIDKASHAFGYKYTERTKIMFGPPGVAYVYLIYGMYYCFNVVTEPEKEPSAVLIRGIKPIENIEKMAILRYGKPFNELTNYQKKNFSNGPGKLCMAMHITKHENGLDLQSDSLYIEENEGFKLPTINIGKRINIDYAEEAKDFLWRFYIEY